jgi:hypothetical protein
MISQSTDKIQIWDIEDNTVFRCLGSQKIFNIRGRIDLDKSDIKNFYYVLNNSKSNSIPIGSNGTRLVNEGDFNIDTILVSELKHKNSIDLCIELKDGNVFQISRNFFVEPSPISENCSIDFSEIDRISEVAQIVDGNWQLMNDLQNGRCLKIDAENAGWDRIILFGSNDLKSNFEITAKLSVEKWVGNPHGVGILFHWKDHLQGDGTKLPSEWNTSLAWYYTFSKGLQIKNGVNGKVNELASKYYFSNRSLRKLFRVLLNRGNGKKFRSSDLQLGSPYFMKLRAEGEKYLFKIWQSTRKEPDWLVTAKDSTARRGAVGINAHRAAVNVYSFQFNKV